MGFVFDSGQDGSYEQMQRRRKMAETLARQSQGTPRDGWEGANALVAALMANRLHKKADATDGKLRAEFEGQISPHMTPNMQGLSDLASSPYANSGQKKVLEALMKGAPNFARGGTMPRNGDAVVGEFGPEVVKLPKGAKVLPTDEVLDPEMMDQEMQMTPEEMLLGAATEGDLTPPGMRPQLPEGVQVADMSGIDMDNLPYGKEKLTGDQSKSIVYHRRAFGANNTLNDPKFAEALTQYTDTFAGNFGAVGRKFQDADFQVGNRAANEFLAAILRKDTGAAVTKQEFELYAPMYLPQPGDKPELLEAKRKAREEAVIAIEMGLGTAAPLAAKTRQDLTPEQQTSEMSDEELLKLLTGG